MDDGTQARLPNKSVQKFARRRTVREIINLFSPISLLRECRTQILRNPYYWRIVVFDRERLVRRMAIGMLVAFGVFLLSSFAVTQFGGSTLAVWGLGYLLARAALILRTALVTASLTRRNIQNGTLHELHLTQLSATEIASGWALEAWLRTIPETLIVFAALYPWGANAGGLAALLPLTGVIALLMYQGIAALTTSRVTLDYDQRREAVAAGWIGSTLILPLGLWLLVVCLGIFLLVPIVLLFQASTLIGEIMRFGLDLSRWIDLTLGEVAEIMANLYFLVGSLFVYLLTLLVFLCQLYLAKDTQPPQVHGYFEHGNK